jgi:pimeloyl-ACP methyl ester carboxylesterase
MPEITIGGKTVHYLDEGTGPTILFGHSFLFNSSSWQFQIEALSHSFRCIVPDLWGHGQSSSINEQSYSVEQLSDDMWQFAQALNLDKFSLIGLSVGGMWATHLTLNHPKNIEKLVLMGTYVGPEEKEMQPQYLGMLSMVDQAQCVPQPIIDKVIPMFFSKSTLEETGNPLVKMLNTNLRSINTHNASTIARLGKAIFTRNSVLDKLGIIDVPTLILVGEEDMPRPPHEAKEMSALIKNSTLEVIEKAGHVCALEQPDKINHLLLSFFNQ